MAADRETEITNHSAPGRDHRSGRPDDRGFAEQINLHEQIAATQARVEKLISEASQLPE